MRQIGTGWRWENTDQGLIITKLLNVLQNEKKNFFYNQSIEADEYRISTLSVGFNVKDNLMRFVTNHSFIIAPNRECV